LFSLVTRLGSEDEGICYAIIEKDLVASVRASMPLQVKDSDKVLFKIP
jgi:hypothetical protein